MSSPRINKPRLGFPSNAKLVFKGAIFEVWQWEQKMFDGTMQTFERIWRPPTVEVIATVDDKVLIEEQDQPDRLHNINLPSGRANHGNMLLNEAKRELLEETGYESDDWNLFLKHGRDGKVIHEVYYFIARNCKKVKDPELDAGERIEVRFITFDDLLMLADEPRFWVSPEFINYLLRVRIDPQKREKFRKLLF